jgi:sigma54-dependent transcription regulator
MSRSSEKRVEHLERSMRESMALKMKTVVQLGKWKAKNGDELVQNEFESQIKVLGSKIGKYERMIEKIERIHTKSRSGIENNSDSESD